MRVVALETATELDLEIELEEINDTEQLSRSNPLDLPRLYLNGELIASRNPPKSKSLVEQLRSACDQT
jgi:hypothetical protein